MWMVVCIEEAAFRESLLDQAIGEAGLRLPSRKFPVRPLHDRQEVVEPGQEIVVPFVPALGAAVEDVVVVGFRLFDQALQTDVATHFDTVLVEGELGEEPRDAAVAVAEGVDAEEVEDEGSSRDEGRRQVLVDARAGRKGRVRRRQPACRPLRPDGNGRREALPALARARR